MDSRLIVSASILIVLLEICIIVLFLQYRKGKIEGNPFILIFKKESLILFYAFFRWKKSEKAEKGNQKFFYHKNSNYFWLFLALIHEQLIEMVVFHIYLKNEEPEIATIMLVLHIYSVFYMMGDYNLVRNSPVILDHNKVFINIGARRTLNFHIRDIERVQAAKVEYAKSGSVIEEKNVFHVTAFPRILTRLFGVRDEASYEVTFKNPIQAHGYFGQKKPIQKALFYIDEPGEFIEALQKMLGTYADQPEEVDESVTASERGSVVDWEMN